MSDLSFARQRREFYDTTVAMRILGWLLGAIMRVARREHQREDLELGYLDIGGES